MSTVRVNAFRLFDISQLILLEYGATNLDSSLRVPQVIAPQGVNVSLDSADLTTATVTNDADDGVDSDGFNNRLAQVELTVANTDGALSGPTSVQWVLENTATGQTFSVNVLVSTAF